MYKGKGAVLNIVSSLISVSCKKGSISVIFTFSDNQKP